MNNSAPPPVQESVQFGPGDTFVIAALDRVKGSMSIHTSPDISDAESILLVLAQAMLNVTGKLKAEADKRKAGIVIPNMVVTGRG